MTQLEQALADLCRKHDLTSATIEFFAGHTKPFSVWFHSMSNDCINGHGDTIAQALGNAIAQRMVQRGLALPVELPDEVLVVETVDG